MQKLQDILTSADVPGRNEQPSTSTSWCLRQSAAQDEWRKARRHHPNCLLSCNSVPERNCSHCRSPAIIHCRDCMPEEWLHIHTKLTLHNRESCIEGVYKPIEPTLCCAKEDGRYTLVKQGSCWNFFVKWLKLCLYFFIFFAPCKCGGWKVRLAENGSHTSISLSQGSCGYRCSLPPRCECAWMNNRFF